MCSVGFHSTMAVPGSAMFKLGSLLQSRAPANNMRCHAVTRRSRNLSHCRAAAGSRDSAPRIPQAAAGFHRDCFSAVSQSSVLRLCRLQRAAPFVPALPASLPPSVHALAAGLLHVNTCVPRWRSGGSIPRRINHHRRRRATVAPWRSTGMTDVGEVSES